MIEKTIRFHELESLLEEYDVLVESPDGFVPVTEYVTKGEWQEWIVRDDQGNEVRVNENHLFQTDLGWKRTKDMINGDKVLRHDGKYHPVFIEKTGNKIPIVDLVIDHPEHRYYANGFCSHNTGIGKTAMMCHLAVSYARQGRNVLYVTLEMAEERIAERLDANILDIPLDDLEKTDALKYSKKIKEARAKISGNIMIKEFPTASANVNHINHVISELEVKKRFKPDVIIVDYINICNSSRFRSPVGQNSYTLVKAVAEELRGLAVEKDVMLLTATQTNRDGFSSTDPDLTNTAESFGLPATADMMFAMFTSEELIAMNQVMVKQLKNRYADKNKIPRFVLGVDYAKMRFFDANDGSSHIEKTPGGPSGQTQGSQGYSFGSGRDVSDDETFDDWEV